jgi:hypothetical protein
VTVSDGVERVSEIALEAPLARLTASLGVLIDSAIERARAVDLDRVSDGVVRVSEMLRYPTKIRDTTSAGVETPSAMVRDPTKLRLTASEGRAIDSEMLLVAP